MCIWRICKQMMSIFHVTSFCVAAICFLLGCVCVLLPSIVYACFEHWNVECNITWVAVCVCVCSQIIIFSIANFFLKKSHFHFNSIIRSLFFLSRSLFFILHVLCEIAHTVYQYLGCCMASCLVHRLKSIHVEWCARLQFYLWCCYLSLHRLLASNGVWIKGSV